MQVEFADNKPVICPTISTTHSFYYSNIMSVLPLHYHIVNVMPVFGARVLHDVLLRFVDEIL